MKFVWMTGGLAALALAGAAHGATKVIDFEELAHDGPGLAFQPGGLTQQGYRFRNTLMGTDTFAVFGRNDARNGDAGGATLATYYGNTTTRVERTDSGAFDLGSIDLGDYANSGTALTVWFSFYGMDGSTSVQQFDLDRLAGLQTVSLGKVGLRAFEYAFLGSWGQVDNIVINEAANPVPEPASWALLIMGFAGIGAAMRRNPPRRALSPATR